LTIGGVIQNDDVAGRSLTKAGGGTLELRGANSYTGTTTVNAGTLKMGANNVLPNASNVTIGTATLDANTRTDTAGTLNVTGTDSVINLGTGAALAFANSSGVTAGVWAGTLDITGTFIAGNDVDPELDVNPGSIRFGTDNTGLTATQLAAISVNGSGAGTYTLDAFGYLKPSGGGPGPVDSFEISAISSPQTVGTPITGITITAKDASNATATSFTGTVTFGGTGGFTGTSASFTAGVLSGVSVTPTVAGSNLTFTVDDGASHTGSTSITTIQTQYQAWASGAAFDADANNDGVKNGMAFLLGAASPTSPVSTPTVTENGGDLILNFNCLPDAARGNATLRVEHSSDLGVLDPWTATTNEVPDATNAVPDNDVTFVVVAGPVGPPALNSVTATIASAAAAGNKLFGRLKAEQAP
jgi:autotransporter-associated beta strand protein